MTKLKTAALEKSSHLEYFNIAASVDCVIFGYADKALKVLLIKSDLEEFAGMMSLLGDRAWWLPRWLAHILPSVDFEKPLPKADIGDLVIIPDDISTLAASAHSARTCGHRSALA